MKIKTDVKVNVWN